ncbi:MAG: SRPBCC family protein [Bacilli bacterium]
MTKRLSIAVEARSSAHRSILFGLLTDASTWTEWTPFSTVVIERAGENGAGGVGEIKRTHYVGLTGRERILSVTPDQQMSYAYVSGAFSLFIKDYVAVVDVEEMGSGSVVHWRASFVPRFVGSGLFSRIVLRRFLQQCAEGLAKRAVEAPGAQLVKEVITGDPE